MFIPIVGSKGSIHHQAIRHIQDHEDGNGATATLASGDVYHIAFGEEIIGAICEGVIPANGDYTMLTYISKTCDIQRQPIIGWRITGIFAPEPITPKGGMEEDDLEDGVVLGILYPDARVLATQYSKVFENIHEFRDFCQKKRIEWLKQIGSEGAGLGAIG